jgi:putative transposase
VKRILKKAGLEPGPKRGGGTWDEFLKRHAATLVQCDFLNKRIWTVQGLRDVFVLVFLHVGTRRVFVTPTTTNPTDSWVREQTGYYLQHAKAARLPVKLLFHDNDTKFTKALDRDLVKRQIDVRKTAFRSPNTNAFVDRFIQTIQVELLDHFVVLGQRHFNYLVKVWLDHYHTERPHQSKENDLLVIKRDQKRKPARAKAFPVSDVRCEQRLGGLLKHYYRKAS